MKELSIEEKAKRYDEAIEIARALNNGKHIDTPSGTTVCECIFPEIKENKDENIRKSLIGFLITISSLKDGQTLSNEDFDSKVILDWAVWLEKQDNNNNTNKAEQKPNYCHHEVNLSNCSEEYRKAYYDGWNNCNMQYTQLDEKTKV